MINHQERAIVEVALGDYLAGYPADPRGPLVTALGARFCWNLKTCCTPAEYAVAALRLCLDAGWTNNPTDLENLISPIAHRSAALASLCARIPGRRPAPIAPPWDEVLLPCQKIVLDRNTLRRQLQLLIANQLTKPVLVVEGPSGTGKSHSGWLVRHICEHQPGLLAAFVHLQRGQEASTGAVELAKDLAFEIGGELHLPDPDTTAGRYSLELARRVVNLAMNQPQSVWITIDGFHGPDLREDARALIVDLADQMMTHRVKAKGTRLILLGFDRAYLRVGTGSMHIDTVSLPSQADVEMFLAEMARRVGEAIDAERAATAIWSGLPADGTRMATLHASMLDVALSILRTYE